MSSHFFPSTHGFFPTEHTISELQHFFSLDASIEFLYEKSESWRLLPFPCSHIGGSHYTIGGFNVVRTVLERG